MYCRHSGYSTNPMQRLLTEYLNKPLTREIMDADIQHHAYTNTYSNTWCLRAQGEHGTPCKDQVSVSLSHP